MSEKKNEKLSKNQLDILKDMKKYYDGFYENCSHINSKEELKKLEIEEEEYNKNMFDAVINYLNDMSPFEGASEIYSIDQNGIANMDRVENYLEMSIEDYFKTKRIIRRYKFNYLQANKTK